MTLIISAHGKDFVVLGADSRGTMVDQGGNRVEINTEQKIVQVGKQVSVLLYGDAAAARFLIAESKKQAGFDRLDVAAAAKALWTVGRSQLSQIPPLAWKEVPSFGLIVSGVQRGPKSRKIPRSIGLYSSEGFFPREYPRYSIKGKPLIAMFLFARRYKDDYTEDEMVRLVAQALYDTMNIDGDVGGDLNIAIIDSSGTRSVPKGDLRSMIDAWGRPIL